MAITGEEIRVRGLAALRKELGLSGVVKFLKQYAAGSGDYTSVRAEAMAGLTIDKLRSGVKKGSKPRKTKRQTP